MRRWPIVVVAALLAAACGGAAQTPVATPGTASPSAPASQEPAGAAATPEPGALVSESTRPHDTAITSEGLAGATVLAIAGMGDQIVAVGAQDGVAAAWTWVAADGWQRQQVEGARQAGQLRAVAYVGDRFIAFGGGDDAPSTLWTSSDGSSWTPRATAGGIPGRINAAASAGQGLLAVGDVVDETTEGVEASAGMLLASDDGETWRTVADDLRGSEITVSGVAASGDAVVVAGFDVDGGRMWRQVGDVTESASGDFSVSTIQGVAAHDGGFVALGRNFLDLTPVLWTAGADAATWERVTLDGTVFTPTDDIHGLSALEGVLVAVGASPDGGVIWTSLDGRTWTRADA